MKMSVDLFCSLIFTSGIFKIGNEKNVCTTKIKTLVAYLVQSVPLSGFLMFKLQYGQTMGGRKRSWNLEKEGRESLAIRQHCSILCNISPKKKRIEAGVTGK